MILFEPIRNLYGRFERPISSLSLILGFVFDILTLKRIDTLWENFWILGHLVVIGIFIALIHIKESEAGDEGNPGKAHFWYVNILQFFFGGILSAYLVFYFRSADILSTWPFIAILSLALLANESLKRHYTRFTFQLSLFFLSIYSFAIFLVPVLLHKIGAVIFLFSGIISLVAIFIFIKLLFYFTKDKLLQNRKRITFLILGIFLLVNFLYFANLIPPIPLSLKDAGVYHSIEKDGSNYRVTYEDHGWQGYFSLYPEYKTAPGAPIYAFSAIFSPKDLDLTIIHEWQYFDKIKGNWTTQSTINLQVVGGRDGGFRTYSMRTGLTPGKWRVNMKTEQGQIIGRLRFSILFSDTTPLLTTMIK